MGEKMKKWEYLVEKTSKKYNLDLDELGSHGWELIAVIPLVQEKVIIPIAQEQEHPNYKYIFKKRKRRKLINFLTSSNKVRETYSYNL